MRAWARGPSSHGRSRPSRHSSPCATPPAIARGPPRCARRRAEPPTPAASPGPTPRSGYKERLDDLRAELDEAERFNDGERASRARREIEFLTDELAKSAGIGGRDRRAARASERARVNVTRTIAAVMKKIAASS